MKAIGGGLLPHECFVTGVKNPDKDSYSSPHRKRSHDEENRNKRRESHRGRARGGIGEDSPL